MNHDSEEIDAKRERDKKTLQRVSENLLVSLNDNNRRKD
jgi:hypothetical protein